MTTITADELGALVESVRGVLARHWTLDTRLRDDRSVLAPMLAQAIEHGWTDVADAGGLAATLTLARELGRAGCPLPLAEGHVAAELLGGELADELRAGSAVVTITSARPGEPLRFLEATGIASHVVVLPAQGGEVAVHALGEVVATPGIAEPGWGEHPAGVPIATVEVAPEELARGQRLLRLALVARAIGAASRVHELALEHAKTRRQFGREIGRFQAVSHRLADTAIDAAASGLLFEQAIAAAESGLETWPRHAELATFHGLDAAPRMVLAAQHTLGGVGYFEEHEAPWLFRRVHADVTRARLFEPAGGTLGDLLFSHDGPPLPALDMGPRAEAFRDEVRAFLAEHWPPGSLADLGDGLFDVRLRDELVARGWLGSGWPQRWGGQERAPEELLVLAEEVRYAQAPVGRLFTAADLNGNAILRHGSDAQRERLLGPIRRGEMTFCLGYSEPEAGSDLASLRTRATRDADGWLINGQKIYTTFGDRADYVWLAVRTDPEAVPPHKGISMFILPMTTPGITVQRHRALNGEISCSVFYDDVRATDDDLVGEVDGGWKVITDALIYERILMGGHVADLRRTLDELVDAASADPRLAPAGSWRRQAIAEIACALQVARLFVAACIRIVAAGDVPRLEAPMAKVVAGTAAEQLGETALAVLGPAAALSQPHGNGLSNDGSFEHGLRLSVMYVVGGGTNDIQRNLIARRLGLPKA